MKKAVEEDNCCFGTIDTWLLYKLTKGKGGLTDLSQLTRGSPRDQSCIRETSATVSSFRVPNSLLFGTLVASCCNKAKRIFTFEGRGRGFKMLMKLQSLRPGEQS